MPDGDIPTQAPPANANGAAPPMPPPGPDAAPEQPPAPATPPIAGPPPPAMMPDDGIAKLHGDISLIYRELGDINASMQSARLLALLALGGAVLAVALLIGVTRRAGGDSG